MAEYIKRETAIEVFEWGDADVIEDYGDGCDFGFSREAIKSAINSISTADVAQVVHGRWDNIPNTYMSVASKDGSYSGNATTCSVCHEVNPNAYKTNYCPNCGAKMDGGTA